MSPTLQEIRQSTEFQNAPPDVQAQILASMNGQNNNLDVSYNPTKPAFGGGLGALAVKQAVNQIGSSATGTAGTEAAADATIPSAASSAALSPLAGMGVVAGTIPLGMLIQKSFFGEDPKRPFLPSEAANSKLIAQQLPGLSGMSEADRENIATQANNMGILRLPGKGGTDAQGNAITAEGKGQEFLQPYTYQDTDPNKGMLDHYQERFTPLDKQFIPVGTNKDYINQVNSFAANALKPSLSSVAPNANVNIDPGFDASNLVQEMRGASSPPTQSTDQKQIAALNKQSRQQAGLSQIMGSMQMPAPILSPNINIKNPYLRSLQ